jgi:hypothetical protein
MVYSKPMRTKNMNYQFIQENNELGNGNFLSSFIAQSFVSIHSTSVIRL